MMMFTPSALMRRMSVSAQSVVFYLHASEYESAHDATHCISGITRGT